MNQNAEFDRCIDFLLRMFEKYGGELELGTEEIESPNVIVLSQERQEAPEREQFAA